MAFKILQRLLQSFLVLLATGLLAFLIMSFAPDPVDNIAGDYATTEDRARIRAELGYDRPFLVQYGEYMVKFVQWDLGSSLRTSEPVAELIASRAPATLELVLVSTIMTLGAGIWLGIFTGVHRRSKRTQAILTTSLLGISMPTFLLGLLAI